MRLGKTSSSADRVVRLAGLINLKSTTADTKNQFDGIHDIFDDGSVFAISVLGVHLGQRGVSGAHHAIPAVLLTGDTCHRRWGWDHSVEPGDFTRDKERNLKNLKAPKALVAPHPSIQERLGHQPYATGTPPSASASQLGPSGRAVAGANKRKAMRRATKRRWINRRSIP